MDGLVHEAGNFAYDVISIPVTGGVREEYVIMQMKKKKHQSPVCLRLKKEFI